MKKLTFILLLIINQSCISSNEEKPIASSKPQETQNSFLECLDETQKEQLIALKKSFNNFIKKNYNSSRAFFLKEILEGKTKDYSFEKSDSTLIVQLRRDSFLNIANNFVPLEKRFKYLSEPKRSEEIEKTKDMEHWDFDVAGKYLTCLNSLSQKDSLTIQYLKIKNTVGDLSPQVLSNSLLVSLDKKYDRENEMIDFILIVELYYYILNWKIEKS